MENKPRIFISYARSDGEDFALKLRDKLVKEFGEDAIWRDRDKMEGGIAWWQQITDALDTVEYMVLVASPNAMTSPVVRKEWRYARQQGVCVYPVQMPTLPVDFESLPRWMSDSHFYNLDKEWDTFLAYLRGKCDVGRVPFFGVPDLPAHFVERPDEFKTLLAQLLDEKRDNPVAITTSLTGAGGFGKTTLAAALCHDEDVQSAFDDGVLWITLGEEPRVVDELSKLYRAITGEIPHFVDAQEGASMLAEKLAERDILLVIDDVWNPSHLRPFLQGGERCARLITTRFVPIAVEAKAKQNHVDEMSRSQSVQLLLSGIDAPADLRPFEALAVRLGEWALMLEIANGMLRNRMALGNSLAKALEWLLQLLEKRKVVGIQRDNEEGRKRSALGVLGASFELLDEVQKAYLFQLAIFKDDSDIPLSSIKLLWGLDEFDSDEHLSKFALGSLIKYDPERSFVRIHDVVREILSHHLTERGQSLASFHAKLLKAYGDLTALPDKYAWENIAWHLMSAEMSESLRQLLLNIDFLNAKLKVTNANALIADCNHLLAERPIALLQSALNMSNHILSQDVSQLSLQLYGRLIGHKDKQAEIAVFLEQINQHVEALPNPYLLPIHPTMQQAGGAMIKRLLGHESPVNAVAVSGEFAVSASHDKNLIVWNWQTGELMRKLEGHSATVNAVALQGEIAISASADKRLIVWNWQTGERTRHLKGLAENVNAVALQGEIAISASADRSLIVWNWQTGELLRRLKGHSENVNAVALQGEIAISASADRSLIVWNWQTGELLRHLKGHSDSVSSVALQGEIAISASADRSLIVWNWQTGEFIRRLEAHSENVNAVALQGEIAISASDDKKLIVWNWQTGELIRRLEGHTFLVNAVVLQGEIAVSASSDKSLIIWNWRSTERNLRILEHSTDITHVCIEGEIAISASYDKSLIVWNWRTGELIRHLNGHSEDVRAVALQSEIAVSASGDKRLIVWNWQTGELIRHLNGHSDWVNSVALQDEFAVSASWDERLIVWNWQTGELIRHLNGHSNWVNSVALQDEFAISASDDKRLIVWNWQTGELIRRLEAHSKDVNSVALQSKIAVSASGDKSLIVWNWQTGELVRRLEAHSEGVNSVALQSKIAVSASNDRSLKLWNWHDKECLLTILMDAVQFAVALDKGIIAAGEAGGGVHFFRANAALRKLLDWD